MVPVLPWARGGDAERKVNVTRAWERELCWFMTVAAVARLLLPRLSIWRYYVCIRCVCVGGCLCPRWKQTGALKRAALPGAGFPG